MSSIIGCVICLWCGWSWGRTYQGIIQKRECIRAAIELWSDKQLHRQMWKGR